MCPPLSMSPAVPQLAPHRYDCEHVLVVPGRQDVVRLHAEPFGADVLAVAWLMARAYEVAATYYEAPAVTAGLLALLDGVQVEALAVLASGRGRGYGLRLPTPAGTHTLRLLRSGAPAGEERR